MFMRQILDLAQTYQWSEAVLPLALNFHQYILDKGELSTENNLVTTHFVKNISVTILTSLRSRRQTLQPDLTKLGLLGLLGLPIMKPRCAISSTQMSLGRLQETP
jgi:hypothetical protein